MKRQLSAREVILLGLFLALALVGGYVLLFYNPMTEELERLESEKISCEEQFRLATARLEEKKRMEQELAEIFAANPNPSSLAPYDNQKLVMEELNFILQSVWPYSLSFSTVDQGKGDGIVRRRIALNFTSGSYEKAKEVLGKLHDSDYRCMLDDLNVSLGEGGALASVSATLVFFEYQWAVSE